MIMKAVRVLVPLSATLLGACVTGDGPPGEPTTMGDDLRRYQSDVDLLRSRLDVVELVDGTGRARVAIVPAYQGRVMTSTADGLEGWSLGWINQELVTSGETLEHMNPYGGEDRFWLGPEGGQYALFFGKDAPFDLEHWQTPPLIDTEPFDLVESDERQATFRRQSSLVNRAGFTFDLQIDRTVRLLLPDAVSDRLGAEVPEGVDMVAFETENRVTNVGEVPWTKETGLLSIWVLGMFPPSDRATVVIPYVPGPEDELGSIVNDAYFGEVPGERLFVGEGVLFFRADGRHRSKIGLSPRRARPVCGSFDPVRSVLTLVWLTIPEGASDYVNSMWETQEEPFGGDVVNSYNDGPPEPGAKPLGPFYELESSSPGLALEPEESHTHVHLTAHLQGSADALDPVARAVLGVGLSEVEGMGRP